MGGFLGIDLGTSALKCLVADEAGRILAASRRVLPRLMPVPGWLEQQPDSWWQAAEEAIRECVEGLNGQTIEAVSFSGNMSNSVLLGRDREPLRNAMLIADSRARPQALRLQKDFGVRFISATGNPPMNAFAAARLLWVAENEPEVYRAAHTILFAKDFLRLKLCGEAATEPSDAGNSLLLDSGGRWNRGLAADIGLDPGKLAPLVPSAKVCGRVTTEAARRTGLLAGTPVVAGAADMACSQAGTGALGPDITALTLSTSIQLVEASSAVNPSLTGRMTYHFGAMPDNRYVMASIFSGGMSIDWLMRLIGRGRADEADYARIKAETLQRFEAGRPPKAFFLPFLTGSGSPWFHATDTGVFYGLGPDTDAEELMLAVFEGISFNVRDNLDILAGQWPRERQVFLAGGGSRFPVWPHMIADVLGRPVQLLRSKDAATLGAAMLAGLGAGAFRSLGEGFAAMNTVERRYEPDPGRARAGEVRYQTYRSLLHTLRGASE